MKRLLSLGLFALFLGVASRAEAASITWTLRDVYFADGTGVTGTLDYDAVANLYTDWNIQVYNGAFSAFVYNPTNSAASSSNSSVYALFYSTSDQRAIELQFWNTATTTTYGLATILTDPSATSVDLYHDLYNSSPSSEGDFDGSFRGITDGGRVTTPEPASLSLLAIGITGLGLVVRKRRS